MKMISRLMILSSVLWALPAFAAERSDLHVAVYSAGFLVDTQRQVTYGDRVRHVKVKTQSMGAAKGEAPDSSIEIDRLDKGVQWFLDPKTKTYTQVPYQSSNLEEHPAAAGSTPTLKISKIDPQVKGPLGSDTINGFPCQSYTIRIVADFTNPQTGKVVATETLLEKLWVTDKAPLIQKYRKDDEAFRADLAAYYGTEKATFRWLLREFNKHILAMNGNSDDFKSLQMTYQGARASIKGVTVRELGGWNWRPLDASAPGADTGMDMNALIASIAAGLGAPPEAEGKTPMTDAEKPKWVQELEKDLGRTGPTAMILEEVLKVQSAQPAEDFFDIPMGYRKS